MKNVSRLLFVPALIAPLLLDAQITIGESDMPSAGDTVRFRNTTLGTQDLSATGAAHVWDFSDLAPQVEGADTAVSVSSTPFLYQLYFNNNIIYPAYHADFAMRGASLTAGTVSLEDVYEYYKKDADGYRDVGFGATINGLPASVQRDPIDRIYSFPMAFGNSDDSPSHFELAIPTLGYYGQDQQRHNDVDGWGTLYLPADTFEVLRVVSQIDRTDSIYVDQFGFGFSLPEPQTVEYKWLAQGMDEPVLQVTTVGGIPTVVRFFYEPNDLPTSVAAASSSNKLHLWPVPANDVVHISTDGRAGTINILASDGRVVRSIATNGRAEQLVDVSDLAPGLYVVHRLGDVNDQRLIIAR